MLEMQLEGKVIYIVEDDAMNRAVIKTILERNGATVHFDKWGQDTIEKMLQLEHIDLLLMDLMLPRGMTGYQVFEHVQEESTLKDIPAIVVSASDPALEMRKARDKGFKGFISKPIKGNSIIPALLKVMDGGEYWADDI